MTDLICIAHPLTVSGTNIFVGSFWTHLVASGSEGCQNPVALCSKFVAVFPKFKVYEFRLCIIAHPLGGPVGSGSQCSVYGDVNLVSAVQVGIKDGHDCGLQVCL